MNLFKCIDSMEGICHASATTTYFITFQHLFKDRRNFLSCSSLICQTFFVVSNPFSVCGIREWL